MFNGLSQSTLKVRSRGEKMHAELEVCLSTYRHTAGQKILKCPGKILIFMENIQKIFS